MSGSSRRSLDLPRELRRLDVEHGGQPLHELVATFAGHVPGPELDCGSGDIRHDHASAPVEDRPSRRFDSDQAELIALRCVEVLVAGEHLQRPQPEEQDDEYEESERAEDRDAQRKLRRQPVRLADSRIRRQEAPRRRSLLLVRAGRHDLDEDLDLGGRRRPQLLTHDRTDEPVHRECEQQVQDERRRQRCHEGMLRYDLLVEKVVEDVSEDSREESDRSRPRGSARHDGHGRSSRRSALPRSQQASGRASSRRVSRG